MPTAPRIDLGVVLPPKARHAVYVVFVLALFGSFLLDIAYGNNPHWLTVTLRVLDGASPFVLLLAAVNTPTGVVVDGSNATVLGTSNAEREAARDIA